MRLKGLKKIISIISTFAILFNSIAPYSVAIAQEITPLASPEPTAEAGTPETTVTPTVEPTVSPTEEPTATPTETTSPTPEITPTPTDIVTPAPSDTPIATQTPESNPTVQGPPASDQPTFSPTATPTVTPIQPEKEGSLTAQVLETYLFSETLQENSWFNLVTDKLDYAPTEAAIISGSNFIPNTTYSLTVSSTDDPATSTTVDVTTDSNASFTYTYQLDGNYRPDYKVEVKDADIVVASITFTDSATPAIVWPTIWTTPNSCISDPVNDENPSSTDLIGTTTTPAVGFSSDINYQYFRERVDGNPNGNPSGFDQFAWVTVFQTTGTQYQYLGSVNGVDEKVQLYQNTAPAGTVDFDPLLNDPAETLLWEGNASDYARVTTGGDGKKYVEWAIPVTELTSRGITISTTKLFATSANANNFNKDHLSCYEAFADLSIVKSDSPDPVVSGEVETYTLSIHNAGPDTASGVIVTDTLPVEFAVTTVTPSQGSCSDISAPSIQCELGSMISGANATVTIVGALTGSGTVTNTTNVSLDTTLSTDLNLSNNTDTEDTTINPATGTITVNKILTPSNDPGKFNLKIDGTIAGTGIDVGNNGTTGSVAVTIGPHTVSETQGTGTSLSDYTAIIGGDCASDGSVTVSSAQDKVCTITNTRNTGKIELQKDFIGTSEDITIKIGTFQNGSQIDSDVLSADGTNGEHIVNTGTYFVSETLTTPANYTNTLACYNDLDDSDTYNQGDTVHTVNTSTGEVSVGTNDDVLCVYTNTRKTGNIVIDKIVSGGAALGSDWIFTIFGVLGSFTDGDNTTLNTGTYTISESDTVSGYTLTAVGGICATQEGLSATLTVTEDGGTCTFTNTRDTGNLQITKLIDADGDVNTTDDRTPAEGWVMDIDPDGQDTSDPSIPTTNASGTTSASDIKTGNYWVSEDTNGPTDNYHFLGSSCTLNNESTGTSGTSSFGGVVVAKDQTTYCTFINARDTGTVIVHKDVQGPNGENVTDASNSFEVSLDGGTGEIISDNLTVTYYDVPTGSHTVTESLIDPDYTLYGIGTSAGASGNTGGLTFTVTTGTNDVYVTNRQKSGTITVIKDVINPDGGAISDTHSFTVNLSPVTQSSSFAEGSNAVFTVNPGTYTASESTDSEYTSLGCLTPTGKTDIVVGSSEQKTVTCTNQQKKATITVVKQVVLSDGVTPALDGNTFETTLNGESKDFSQGLNAVFSVNPGTYSATESAETNYTLISNSGEVTVESNGDTTITIVNKQNPASISGTKYDESQNVLSDWTIKLFSCTASGVNCSTYLDSAITNGSGFYSFTELISGFYQVVEQMQADWTNVSALFHNATLGAGTESTENDFVNTQYGSITVYKNIDMNGDGDLDDAEIDVIQASGWTWDIDGAGNYSASFGENTVGSLLSDTYTISEDQQEGYHVTSLVCDETNYGAVESQEINLASNQDLICTFTNSRDTGDLEVTKYNDLNGNDQQDPGEEVLAGWEINLEDQTSQITDVNGQAFFNNLVTGSYELSETEQTGWTQTNISCQVGDSDQAGVLEDDEYYVNIESDQTTHCLIGNIRDTGNITVDKVTDPSEDTTEFTINLTGESTHDFVLSDTDSPETIAVPTGSYSLNEVAPGGWELSDISCVREVGEGSIGLDESNFEIGSGHNISCTVTNTEVILGVTIDKSNDKSNGAQAGNTVNYTLVVTNTGSQTIFNLNITDALPGGFSYVLGSTTGETTNDPTISGNNLIWEDVTNLEEGESITIHYQVKIASDASVGTYKNIAGCRGDVRSQEETFECDPADSDVQVGQGQSFGGNLSPQVLGASTELPGTGSPTALLAVALGLLTTGFILKRKYAKN